RVSVDVAHGAGAETEGEFADGVAEGEAGADGATFIRIAAREREAWRDAEATGQRRAGFGQREGVADGQRRVEDGDFALRGVGAEHRGAQAVGRRAVLQADAPAEEVVVAR